MKYFLTGIFIFLFSAHIFAIFTSAYLSFWWFDNSLHFIGGAWLALFSLWAVFDSGKLNAPNWPFFAIIIMAMSFAVFVGVLWEIFEFIFDKIIGYRNAAYMAQFGLRDTMSDLFFDLLGALTASICFQKLKRRNRL